MTTSLASSNVCLTCNKCKYVYHNNTFVSNCASIVQDKMLLLIFISPSPAPPPRSNQFQYILPLQTFIYTTISHRSSGYCFFDASVFLFICIFSSLTHFFLFITIHIYVSLSRYLFLSLSVSHSLPLSLSVSLQLFLQQCACQ